MKSTKIERKLWVVFCIIISSMLLIFSLIGCSTQKNIYRLDYEILRYNENHVWIVNQWGETYKVHNRGLKTMHVGYKLDSLEREKNNTFKLSN